MTTNKLIEPAKIANTESLGVRRHSHCRPTFKSDSVTVEADTTADRFIEDLARLIAKTVRPGHIELHGLIFVVLAGVAWLIAKSLFR